MASSNMSTLKISNAIRRLTMEETRDLMFQMGVPLHILKDIADEFKGEHRKQNYVQTWLDLDPDASWEKLITGLRKVNKNFLAAEIESEHHSKTVCVRDGSSPESTPPESICNISKLNVEEVKARIDVLEEEFSDIKSEARRSLTKKERKDSDFFDKFRDHLLDLPVAKKPIHVRFFIRKEDEIMEAKTIFKIFIILGRYCNYSNYEIIFHIVKRFCHELKGRMERYRSSLTIFEKATTVDVYLCAISARPGGEISQGFIRMTMKINKPPSECTLYEIRELKESIEEKASVESYAIYIETPEEGSVRVGLLIPEEVGWMVGAVLTSDFRQEHLLMDVTVKKRGEWVQTTDVIQYLVRNYIGLHDFLTLELVKKPIC